MTSGQGRYGTFRWGEAEGAAPERGPPGPRKPRRVDHPTAEEALGSGLALNPASQPGYDWDLRVDHTGALVTTAGIDEYGKDIAFMTARETGRMKGERLTANALEDVRLTLMRVLESDPRTKDIRRLNLSPSDRDRDTLVVDAMFVAEDDEYHDTVFPLRNAP